MEIFYTISWEKIFIAHAFDYPLLINVIDPILNHLRKSNNCQKWVSDEEMVSVQFHSKIQYGQSNGWLHFI